MLAISSTSAHTLPVRRLHPNLLPCAIKHNGPVPTPERYWKPEPDPAVDTDLRTCYFRGRKLRGRTVKVPEGYHGVVMEKTDRDAGPLPQTGRGAGERQRRDYETASPIEGVGAQVGTIREDQEDDGAEVQVGGGELEQGSVQVKMMEPKGSFEEIVVWGHDVMPDNNDVYVRGVEEWMKVAEAMHLDRGSMGG